MTPASRGRGVAFAVALNADASRGPLFIFPITAALTNGGAPLRVRFDFETFRDSGSNARLAVRLAERVGEALITDLAIEDLGPAADPDPDFSEMGKLGGRAAALRHSWALLLDASRRIDRPLFQKCHARFLAQAEELLSAQEKDGSLRGEQGGGFGEKIRLLSILAALEETPVERRGALSLGARLGLQWLCSNQEPGGRLFGKPAEETMGLAQAASEAFVWIEKDLDDASRRAFMTMLARLGHFSRECYGMDRGGAAFGQRLATYFPSLDASYAAFLSCLGNLLGREIYTKGALAQFGEMSLHGQRPSGAFDSVEGLPQNPTLQDRTVQWGTRLLAFTKEASVQKSLTAALGWVDAYAYPGGLVESGMVGGPTQDRFQAGQAGPAAFLASLGDGRFRDRFDRSLAGGGPLRPEEIDLLFWIPSIKEHEPLPERFFEPNPDNGGFLFRRDGFTAHLTGSEYRLPTLVTAAHVTAPDGPWRSILDGVFVEAPQAKGAWKESHGPWSPIHHGAFLENRIMAQHSHWACGSSWDAGSGAGSMDFGAGAWDPRPPRTDASVPWTVRQTWIMSVDLVVGHVDLQCTEDFTGDAPSLRLPLSIRERLIESTNVGLDWHYRFATLGISLMDVEGPWIPALSPGSEGDLLRLRLPAGDYLVELACGDPLFAIPAPGMRVWNGTVSTGPLICAAGETVTGRLTLRHGGGDLGLTFAAAGFDPWKLSGLMVSNTNGKDTRWFDAGPAAMTLGSNQRRLGGEPYDEARGWGWSRDLSSAVIERRLAGGNAKRALLSSTNLPIELRLSAGNASKAWKRGERLRTFMVFSLAGEGEPLRIPESRIRKGRSASGTCWIAVSDRGSWNLAVWNDGSAAAPYSLALPLPEGAGKVLWSDSDGRRGEGAFSGEKIEGRLEGERVRVMRVGGK